MELIDIGVNLAKPRFDADRDALIARPAAAGVTRMVLTGVDAAASRASADLAAARPGVLFATAGVHPHHATGWPEAEAEIRALLTRPEVVAVGECGLDFDRNYAPPDAQIAAFRGQISLAIETSMPLFLHERAATEAMFAILDEFAGRLPPAVLHCFTGDRAALEGYLARGLHIGITGWICDERRGGPLRQLVAAIPEGRLMLETDAPYLYPRSLPSPFESGAGAPPKNRNEPAFLRHIAEDAAALRAESPEDLARHTTAAAVAFFRLRDDFPHDAGGPDL